MCPFYKRFEKEFGSVMLHYCCTPAPSTHVASALVSGGGVKWVDNWQGYKTLLNEQDYFRTDIGICTDIDKELILSRAINDMPFYNIKRPLVSSVSCDSVADGQLLYEIWRTVMKLCFMFVFISQYIVSLNFLGVKLVFNLNAVTKFASLL